jgi:hypothetical protein
MKYWVQPKKSSKNAIFLLTTLPFFASQPAEAGIFAASNAIMVTPQ